MSSPIPGGLSIDRCTFLLYSPSLSLWEDLEVDRSKNFLMVEKVKDMFLKEKDHILDENYPQGSPSVLFKYHFRTKSGLDIQFGCRYPKRRKVSDLDLASAFGVDSDSDQGGRFFMESNPYAFRVEFNPNNQDLSEISDILSSFSVHLTPDLIRVSRLDVAVDYKFDLVPEFITCNNVRKSFLAYGSKGLESVYFGSRSSKYMFRIYNKRQERIDQGDPDPGYPWWRVELESKSPFSLDYTPDFVSVFDRLQLYNAFNDCDDWTLKLIFSHAINFGLFGTLKLLPRTSAHRYKKLFSLLGSTEFDTPSFICARDFNRSFNSLRSHILKSCGFNVVSDEALYV